jgi:putative ABC transport system ATP-binding protein
MSPGAAPAAGVASGLDSTPLIRVESLAYRYGEGDAGLEVRLPALRLAPGEALALTGESGSGKSTLLELLGLAAEPLPGARFEWQTSGMPRVDVAGLWRARDETALARLRARGIGFVLQTGGLLPFLTVAENIGINRRLQGLATRDASLGRLIEALEIGPLLGRRPGQLSIGQQQRASIGRALAHSPALVLADEPTSALDPRLADRVLGLLRDLAHERGAAVVIATHEVQRVRALGLRMLQASPVDLSGRPGYAFLE